jgi:tRNA dimethylallyltransferase
MPAASDRQPHPDPLLLIILGPTASGKTALALALAEQFHGEIISCDSVSVFREANIGTAKPTPAERARIPHHMLDIASPAHHYTAGDYSRDARTAIREITARHKLPIVSGGTGLYLRALLEGLFPGPQRHPELRERLRTRAQSRGPAHLHCILNRLDPEAATAIHHNDTPKIIRAIEVSLAARQPITEAWKQGRNPLTGYRILRIGLDPPRPQLYERINPRGAEMFAQGLTAETRTLIDQYGEEIPLLNALGYKQARAFLRQEIDAPEAIRQTQQGHRNYAKRQMSWFRREPEVHWLRGFGDNPEILTQATASVEAALA